MTSADITFTSYDRETDHNNVETSAVGSLRDGQPKNSKPIYRLAKLVLLSLVVVVGYFLLDAFVIDAPIQTLGSKSGIEARYQQMMRHAVWPTNDTE